jgi:hypothetical protein
LLCAQVFGDFDSLVGRSGIAALERIRSATNDRLRLALKPVVCADDFERALEDIQHLQAESLGTPAVCAVRGSEWQ